MKKEKFKPIKFPQDEQKHDHSIEWWYFNGNLKAKDGRLFSYMHTLFAAKPKEVNIPFLRSVPLKTLYFSHYLLTDNKKHKFEKKIVPLCLVNSESFTKPLLWVQYDNSCLIEELTPFNYHLVNDFIDLNLKLIKKPLLLNKTGYLDLKTKNTYYYSLTSLETQGLLKVDDKWLSVSGLSWMDHQWSQSSFVRGDKWTWFSLQLENGMDVVCFVYGDNVLTAHASLIDKNSKTKFTDNVIIKPKGQKFLSKETGSEYYLNYEIFIPDFDMQLTVMPFNKKQEMIFGAINYWEGGIGIEGILKDKKIKGQGFMELVGSPMKKSALNIYLNKYKNDILSHPFRKFSQELDKKFKAYK